MYVVFPDKDNESREIHLAMRMQPVPMGREYFESIDSQPLGYVKDRRVFLHEKPPVCHPYGAFEKKRVTVTAEMDRNVKYYRIYPSFDAATCLGRLVGPNNDRVRAVLLELYHSGTGYTRHTVEEYDLTKYIKTLTKEGVLVFGMPRPRVMYATSLELKGAGLIFLKKMSVPAAITKLMWLLAQYSDKSQIENKMLENLRGEISEA